MLRTVANVGAALVAGSCVLWLKSTQTGVSPEVVLSTALQSSSSSSPSTLWTSFSITPVLAETGVASGALDSNSTAKGASSKDESWLRGLLSRAGVDAHDAKMHTTLVLVALGAGFSLATRYYDTVLDWCVGQVTTSVELDSSDESFRWIMQWLASSPYAQCSSRDLCASTDLSRLYGLPRSEVDKVGDDRGLFYTPAPGTHWITCNGHWLWITRRRRAQQGLRLSETITLTTLGRSRHRIQRLLGDAKDLSRDRDRQRTVVFTADQYGNWDRSSSKLRRPLQSVILPDSIADHLVSDVEQFLGNESWYGERGIPWRRSYLLHGPPGCGKTSFVTALAGHLGLNIYAINLASPSLTDDSLASLMAEASERCILLLEDVDAAFAQPNAKEDTSEVVATRTMATGSQLTFSGILNAIDGVGSQEGRLMFFTTNHLTHLDDAFVRPGRVDVRIPFPLANTEQMKRLFMKFYPTAESALATAFAVQLQEHTYSMAALQGFLMNYRDTPEAALRALPSWKNPNVSVH